MTRLTNGAETGFADGTAVTTANSDDNGAGTPLSTVTTTGGALTYSTNTPRAAGALSFRQAVGTSGNAFLRFAAGLAGTTMACRLYFVLESAALTGSTTIIRLLNGSSAAMGQLRLTSALVPGLLNGAGSVMVLGSASLTVGTLYRFEAWVTPGTTTTTGRVYMALYEGDSTTPLIEYASTAYNAGTATTPRSVEVGRSSTAAGAFTIRTDELVLDDGIGETLIGPVPNPSLAGQGASTSDAFGALDARRPLDGVGASTSSASGALGARRPVAGLGSSSSSAVGAIDVRNLSLDGLGASTSSATGALSIGRPLAGVGTSSSSGSGAIDVRNLGIDGRGASTSSATGALSVARPVAGQGASTSLAFGALSARRPLAGVGASITAGFTELGARRPLAAAPGASVSSAAGTIGLLGEGGARIYFRGERIASVYYAGELVTIR